jgi:hypothetical protein
MSSELLEGNMKDFRQKAEQEEKYWNEWEKERPKKRCKCGVLYSFGYETNYNDPGSCSACRGALGEVIYG